MRMMHTFRLASVLGEGWATLSAQLRFESFSPRGQKAKSTPKRPPRGHSREGVGKTFQS